MARYRRSLLEGIRLAVLVAFPAVKYHIASYLDRHVILDEAVGFEKQEEPD